MTAVCASQYGGPGDPGSTTTGYRGDNLTGKMAFAELGMGTLLGNLPYRQKLQITYGGRSVTAEKLDIGAGGPGCGGHTRAIDLWYETANALGFSGLGVVDVKKTPHGESFLEKLNPLNVKPLEKGLGEIGSKAAGAGEFLTDVSPFEHAANQVKHALDWAKGLGKLLEFVTSSSGWVRIAKVTAGGVILIIAVDQLTKIGPTPATEIARRVK